MSALVEESVETPPTSIPWVYLSTASFLVAGGVFYIYLARVLPLGELGSVVILQSIAPVVGTAMTLGLGAGFNHFLSYHRARGELATTRALVRRAMMATALLSLVGFAAVALASDGLSVLFFHSGKYAYDIQLLGAYIGLLTAIGIFSNVFWGLQRFVAYSIVYTVGTGFVFGVPVLFYTLHPSVTSIVLGWILGAAIEVAMFASLLVRWERTGKTRGFDDRPAITQRISPRTILLYSLPVLLSTVLTTGAFYVDRLVLASIGTLSEVGVYNYAVLIASGSLFVISPFYTILVPRISALFGRNLLADVRALARTSSSLVAIIYVPFGLGIAAIGPFLLRLLVGPAFVPASVPMAVLLVITAIFVPLTVLVSLASGIRRTTALARASAVALLANVILCIVLVPRIGITGAALGNSAMSWASFAVLYLELRGTHLVQFNIGSIARIWLAAGAMFVVVGGALAILQYRPIFVVLFVVAGAVIYLAVLRLSRALTDDSAEALIKFLPRWAAAFRSIVCWVAACDDCDHGERMRRPAL